MEEIYYYDFKENLATGSYIEDGALTNRQFELGEDFNLDWEDTNNYGKLEISDDNSSVYMRVNKPSQEERNLSGVYRDEIEIEEELDVDNFIEADTYLLNDNDVQTYTDYIELLVDWESVDLPEEDTGEIKLETDEGEYFILRLFNRRKVQYVFFDGDEEYETQTIGTHDESTANVSHLFSNNISELKLTVRLTDNEEGGYDINVQLSSKGIKSEWIDREFGENKLTKISAYLPYDSDHTAKKLKVHDISIEGYFSEKTYESKPIELDGDTNNITSILMDGEVVDELPLSEDVNTPVLKIDVADDKDNLDLESGKEFTLDEAIDEFSLSEDIDEDYGGNYLQFSITNSTSREYQNAINYILIQYEIEEETIYDFEETSESKTIDSEGGVIKLNDIFDTKLFIPPEALDEEKEITITMLAADDDRIPPNSLAYDLSPSGTNFNEDLLLTLDYSNFEFDQYSNEEGLSVIYVQNYNTDDSEEIDSTVYKDKNKLIAYIEHFSTYMIEATDNMYTNRTKYHAQEFPRWMKLQEKDSVFQQYQNYALNQELDKLHEKKDYSQLQLFIDKADTKQRYISFVVEPKDFETEDGEELTENLDTDTKAIYKGKEYNIVLDEVEFFTRYDNVFYYDTDKKLLHFPRYMDSELKIYDGSDYHYINEETNITENHIWNSFDEIGLLMGIKRLPLESNENFKERILNVREHEHGAHKSGFKNAVKNLILGKSDRLDEETKKSIEKM